MAYERQFHLSTNVHIAKQDPEYVEIARWAGVKKVWEATFIQGRWPFKEEELRLERKRLLELGLEVGAITVPLGHPGSKPPKGWKAGINREGKVFYGNSLHKPICEENCRALKLVSRWGFKEVFVDDDFRLASTPGRIGGCFCAEHKARFLQLHGYGEGEWQELLEAIGERRYCRLVREWTAFVCAELTECFKAQQAAAREQELGIMVMYLGSEKAGIDLEYYQRAGVPFRVGELMFNDREFGPVKGKTNELFSSLFHRRFVEPERAYSETTAFPERELSAENMAAKLVISTLSDVRNTMFMSGFEPFPREHWAVLKPAMAQQAQLHRKVAGEKPAGPFKHFWGKAARCVSDDNPYSLWLALGVPFEVSEELEGEGWAFLGEADQAHLESGELKAKGELKLVGRRRGRGAVEGKVEAVKEELQALFAFKERIKPALAHIPYIEDEKPAVCAWYPRLKAVLVWNLQYEPVRLTLKYGRKRRVVELEPLGSALCEQVEV